MIPSQCRLPRRHRPIYLCRRCVRMVQPRVNFPLATSPLPPFACERHWLLLWTRCHASEGRFWISAVVCPTVWIFCWHTRDVPVLWLSHADQNCSAPSAFRRRSHCRCSRHQQAPFRPLLTHKWVSPLRFSNRSILHMGRAHSTMRFHQSGCSIPLHT